MTRLVFIGCCVIALTIHCTVQLQCGLNEVVDDCPADCASQYCPKFEGENETCPVPESCGKPACKCRFNTRRAANGTCIDTNDCPPFPCSRPNEEFVACPPYCPTDDCSQATPDGDCPLFGFMLMVVECSPKCRCIKGYWRNNGICVPYKECPESPRKQ